ncbi:MAG: phosphoenolpyruvate kinase [Acidobacteriota bacterium]
MSCFDIRMTKTILKEGDEGVTLIIKEAKKRDASSFDKRRPVHVVYGGANLFKHDTTQKLGRIALETLDRYSPNFSEFAAAFHLGDFASLPRDHDAVIALDARLNEDPERVKRDFYAAWFAWTVYRKTREKLVREAVEDFRIDFEDGYGHRSDDEEDSDAATAAVELAKAIRTGTAPAFIGIRVKSFEPETYNRGLRTLEVFLNTLLEYNNNELPPNFAVSLPKVSSDKETKALAAQLKKFERNAGLAKRSIEIEFLVETSEAIIDKRGRFALGRIAKSCKGRCRSAHFGAYDFTSGLGISSRFQDIRHPACDLARQLMLLTLRPHGIGLSDSVTTEIPVAPHKGVDLAEQQLKDNRNAIHSAWLHHFENIMRSYSNGFYQSWDLHPAQLPARFAAVYSFFLDSLPSQAGRLKGFIAKSAKTNLTGNVFDDAASVRGIVTFFVQGLNCGAISDEELTAAVGISADDLRQINFKSL